MLSGVDLWESPPCNKYPSRYDVPQFSDVSILDLRSALPWSNDSLINDLVEWLFQDYGLEIIDRDANKSDLANVPVYAAEESPPISSAQTESEWISPLI